MSNVQTQHAKGIVPSPSAMGQEAVALRVEYTTLAELLTTDVLEMAIIPPGYKVLDWMLDMDDMDSATALVVKVGILNAGKTDLDTGNNIWKTGLTTGQAGGMARNDSQLAARCGSSTSERMVGVIVTTRATTWVDGVIGLTLLLKSI